MFKKLVRRVVDLYFLPIRKSERLSYYLKGTLFTDASQHLSSAIRYIRQHASPARDEVIIDVGGANGGTSIYFANAFPGHQVYCVEPNKRMLPWLREVESKYSTVTVKPLALGSQSGEAVLYVTANDVSSSLNEPNAEALMQTPADFQAGLREDEQIRVRVSSLDEEFKDCRAVLLMKLDTQGTEIEVLKGGAETLKKTRFVLTEMNNHNLYQKTCQYYEIDEFLRSRSFKLADIIVTYRGDDGVDEYDALYRNLEL